MLRHFCSLILLGLLAGSAAGQNVLLPDNPERFIPVWRYHTGDDSLWSHPDYLELGWEPVVATQFWDDKIPEQGWTGLGWFRAKIRVDESAVGVPFAFALLVHGAAEMFVDGVLVRSVGRVGTSSAEEIPVRHYGATLRPDLLVFDSAGEHVLAVRASNFNLREASSIGAPMGGFKLRFANIDSAPALTVGPVRKLTAEQFLFTGIPAAFALVFLLLYLFYRVEPTHLLFAVLCIASAGVVFFDLQAEMTYDGEDFIALRRGLHALIAITMAVALPTTYMLFGQRFPLHAWGFLAIGMGLAVWGWVDPFAVFPALPIFSLVVVVELIRTTVTAVVKHRHRAWIVGLGLGFLALGIAYDSLLDLNVLFPIAGITNGYYYGMTVLEICMAVFLATAFAQTNRQLERQLVQVGELHERAIGHERDIRKRELERVRLEADNQRKSLQLEKAKQLRESYTALEKAHKKLKSTQASLIHSEKMASLGKLASGIAHEIKNPLNFVNNFATVSIEMATELKDELQTEGLSRDSEILEIVDTILGNARRIREHGEKADGVVKSMMEHSVTSSGKKERVDLNALIENYVRLAHRGVTALNEEVDIHVECEFDPDVGVQLVVPQTFSRALLNVLSNAFDAAIEGRGQSETGPVVRVTTSKLRDTVLIRILDNGPGVPQELRERIFEPFFSTKPTGTGTGLGLSLAHDIIVEGHGGLFGLEHLDEQETGFYISIPLVADASETPSAEWPE